MPIRMDVKGATFDVLPEGDYEAVAYGWKRGVSKGEKTKGADQVTVEYKLANGRRVWEDIQIHPSTLWKFKRLAVAAGVDSLLLEGERDYGFSDEFANMPAADLLDPVEIDAMLNEEIVGAPVVLTLGVRPAQGDWPAKNEIKKVANPAAVGVPDATSGQGW